MPFGLAFSTKFRIRARNNAAWGARAGWCHRVSSKITKPPPSTLPSLLTATHNLNPQQPASLQCTHAGGITAWFNGVWGQGWCHQVSLVSSTNSNSSLSAALTLYPPPLCFPLILTHGNIILQTSFQCTHDGGTAWFHHCCGELGVYQRG